ncbi:hypothetical protein L227DRAFT_658559 [Lentinus tigrinus ALCF2SS1-6]|uniref:Uncharacterized protein n=1 Tax=Lentinus tigrinus ALCF2SS1-6 TaxID=1328759 RepID=A0A5C2RNN7_9APHY|nr:hypothetical protein L227DRAFT_658559 [Lentinus tigrinus ALCF2SS1-6]
MPAMFPFLLVALPLSVVAAPVAVTPPAPDSLQPVAILLSLLPFPLLAVVKYAYLRFRRGQSIHAVSCASTKPVSAPASPALSLGSRSFSPSSFWPALHPYLVGIFGSPHWETTISCRIDNTLRRAKPPSPTLSPLLSDSTRTARTNTSTTTGYPTLSSNSHATSRSSRSKYLSVSIVDKSRARLPNDFAVMQPASPPLLQLPPPAHLPHASVRFSVQQSSPTLMQIMEPVLSSWYDDSPQLKPPVLLLNDKSISPSNSSASHSHDHDNSASTGDTSLPFHTPLTSPASPAIPWSRSTPVMPFAQLRQQHTLSASSSVLTISAATIPSPASLSIAVFHSPTAHSIPVPQPVYTPLIRPESCVVLPHDWQQEKENINSLHSPTHRSPAPGAPTMYDCLANANLSPTPLGTRALNVYKAGSTPSRASAKSLFKPVPTSPTVASARDSTASIDAASIPPATDSADRPKSWDLAALEGGDGKLDVDAVTRALGLGAGLGLKLGFTSPTSRSSVASISILSATESEAAVNALLSPVPEDDDGDGEIEDTLGWDAHGHDGEPAEVSTHVHGLPLAVIMEETRSEVASVCTGRGREESGIMSMELDSGMGCEIMVKDDADVGSVRAVESRVSGVWDQSFKEGESTRLSVGVAW